MGFEMDTPLNINKETGELVRQPNSMYTGDASEEAAAEKLRLQR